MLALVHCKPLTHQREAVVIITIGKTLIETKEVSYFADSLGFVNMPGKHPVLPPSQKRLALHLLHATTVPPFITDFDDIICAHGIFFGKILSNNNEEHRCRIRAILNREDLLPGALAGSTGVLFGMQHAPDNMTDERMSRLHQLGMRVMAIAYKQNEYGSGHENHEGRLTRRGEELLLMMARTGMILDLSHAGHATAHDALRYIESADLRLPVMMSHSGCYSVYPHRRNVPDENLELLFRLGGYLGIPIISFLLGGEGSDPLEAFELHLRHAKRIAREAKKDSCVGIGSDLPHRKMSVETAREHYEKMLVMLGMQNTDQNPNEKPYFPDRPEIFFEEGDRIFPYLQDELHLTRATLGGNFLAFLAKSLSKGSL